MYVGYKQYSLILKRIEQVLKLVFQRVGAILLSFYRNLLAIRLSMEEWLTYLSFHSETSRMNGMKIEAK